MLSSEKKYGHEPSYISASATIGKDCSIWRFVNIMDDVVIGDDVSIGGCSEIGRGTTIGNNTRIGYGVFIPNNSKIGRNVFIGPNTTFCDDKHPRCGNVEYDAEPPTIEDLASIGAGVTVLPGITIGMGALVGAGSIVTKNVPPSTVVRGNDYAKPIFTEQGA